MSAWYEGPCVACGEYACIGDRAVSTEIGIVHIGGDGKCEDRARRISKALFEPGPYSGTGRHPLVSARPVNQ